MYVKNVFLEDATEKCKVALWKNTGVQDIRSGDFVEITYVVINTFWNETYLTTTSRTNIIVIIITLYLLQNIYLQWQTSNKMHIIVNILMLIITPLRKKVGYTISPLCVCLLQILSKISQELSIINAWNFNTNFIQECHVVKSFSEK